MRLLMGYKQHRLFLYFEKNVSVYLIYKCSVKSKLFYNTRKQMEVEVVRSKALKIFKLNI